MTDQLGVIPPQQLASQEQAKERLHKAKKTDRDRLVHLQQDKPAVSESKVQELNVVNANGDILFNGGVIYDRKSDEIQQMSVLFRNMNDSIESYVKSESALLSRHWNELVKQTVAQLSGQQSATQLQVMMQLPKLGLLTLEAEYILSRGWSLSLSAKNQVSTQALLKNRQNLCRKICVALDDRIELEIMDDIIR